MTNAPTFKKKSNSSWNNAHPNSLFAKASKEMRELIEKRAKAYRADIAAMERWYTIYCREW